MDEKPMKTEKVINILIPLSPKPGAGLFAMRRSNIRPLPRIIALITPTITPTIRDLSNNICFLPVYIGKKLVYIQTIWVHLSVDFVRFERFLFTVKIQLS